MQAKALEGLASASDCGWREDTKSNLSPLWGCRRVWIVFLKPSWGSSLPCLQALPCASLALSPSHSSFFACCVQGASCLVLDTHPFASLGLGQGLLGVEALLAEASRPEQQQTV